MGGEKTFYMGSQYVTLLPEKAVHIIFICVYLLYIYVVF